MKDSLYVNRVMLAGHLGYPPVLKTAPDGKVFCRFNLATLTAWVDDDRRTQKIQDWHRCVVWGESAQEFVDECKSGTHIELTGRLQPRFIKDGLGMRREIVEVRVASWQVVSGGRTKVQIPLDDTLAF